mgnify:CR=1 FL=1
MQKKLSAENVAERLRQCGCPLLTLCFEEVDSTNSEAKRQIRNGNREPMLLLAETQTAGHGRMGRSFYSPPGTGIYMSLKLPGEMIRNNLMTVSAAVAVSLAIEKLTGKHCAVKWVNDIYLDGLKIAGILAEAVHETKSDYVIGIGINVTTQNFPPELKESAGAIHADISREDLIVLIVSQLMEYLRSEGREEVLQEYRLRSMLLCHEISYYKSGRVLHATALAVTDDGALLVRGEDGREETLIAGEVSLHKTE